MSESVVTLPAGIETDMFASAPQCALYGEPSYGNSPYVTMTPHDAYWMAEFTEKTLSLCSPVWFVGATIKFANGYVITRAFTTGPQLLAPGDEMNVKYSFGVLLTPPARPL